MRKFHYSTDRYNRLVIKAKNKMYPVEGEFKIKNNELIFFPHPKSRFTKELDLPRRIQFEGRWRLDKNHNLCLLLEDTDYHYKGDILEIKGKIIAVEAEELIFQTRFKKAPEEENITLLRLGGRWQADEFNQLLFLVTRDLEEDVLKFSSGWEVNENYSIIYTYEKRDLLTREKTVEYIEFKGYWEICKKRRISYVLDFKNNSFFQFVGYWNIPDERGREGEIKCRIGVGVRKLYRENVFSLLGEWRIKEKNKLLFEIEYRDKGLPGIVFKTEIKRRDDKNLVFALKNKNGEPLGIELSFEMSFLKKNKKFFLRFLSSDKEKRLEGGLSSNW
ncbi:MAG: hypothetical protein NC818_00625 [Candidatus Omnitrophica bacterium]|nr:hypothetical protein [Candidatus Omnitrophota bacterium]